MNTIDSKKAIELLTKVLPLVIAVTAYHRADGYYAPILPKLDDLDTEVLFKDIESFLKLQRKKK